MSDILLLSLGTTIGLRAGDDALAELMQQAGASVELARVRMGATAALRRAYPVIDIVEALAARRATSTALARAKPKAVVFSTSTAALLAPALDIPYAVRLDAPSCLNRPGARNALQHALERRRLRDARLVLPFGQAAAAALPERSAPAVILPQPIARSGPLHDERERVVLAYTPDPKAKGLHVVLAAWAQATLADARLEVFGIERERARRHLSRHGMVEPAGVTWRGRVPAAQFRARLRRAHVFLTGASWEDYGFAQLEALADGAILVCGATKGPFEALIHARALAPALCAATLEPADLAVALREAFSLSAEQSASYRREAAERIAAYEPAALSSLIAERVLPALLR